MGIKGESSEKKKGEQEIILKDQLIICYDIVKKLDFLANKIFAFGREGSCEAAKAYIDFYKNCIKKIEKLLEEGKESVSYSELDCSPTYDFF